MLLFIVAVLSTLSTRAYAESCLIFCVTIQQQKQPSPPPYNSTLINELTEDHQKTDNIIVSFGSDELKAAWYSGKPVSQFTTQEKVMLEKAAKTYNEFNREVDQAGDRIANELIGK